MTRSSGRTRVLHIITDLGVGGSELTLLKLLSTYDRRFFEMSVVSLTDVGAVGEQVVARGVSVMAIGMHPGRITPLDLLRLRDAVRAVKPHVIQTWLYHSDLFGGIVGKLAGVPVVWGIRSLMLDHLCVKRSTLLMRRVCAWLSGRVPSRIVACAEEARRLHISIGYSADKMIVIPNGYDLVVYRPDPMARQSVRKELGVPNDARLLGLVGRFDPQKDHRNFLEACLIVADSLPDVQFLLCGKDISRDNTRLSGWVAEFGLQGRVHLLGPRRDVPRLLAALDVSALSSRSEAFPNVVAEAMACGVPCAVTDVGDAALIVGDTGRLVPPNDSKALGEACRDLLAMPDDMRGELGARARARIEQEFSLAVITARYETLYTEVAMSCAA